MYKVGIIPQLLLAWSPDSKSYYEFQKLPSCTQDLDPTDGYSIGYQRCLLKSSLF